MKNEKSTATDGIGLTLLLIAFIVLKLCHVIEWSWWWVLAPLWGPIAFSILVIIGVSIVGAFVKEGRGGNERPKENR